jgi:hypothetical protein
MVSPRHPRAAHHDYLDQPWFGPVASGRCLCGASLADPVHGPVPCEWCEPVDVGDLGAPAPWWHRLWCRLVARIYGP